MSAAGDDVAADAGAPGAVDPDGPDGHGVPEDYDVDEIIARGLGRDADGWSATSDAADAFRFEELFQAVARYLTDEERWIVCTGTRWERDLPGDLKALALTLGVTRRIREEAEEASDEPGPNNSPSPRQRLARHAVQSESLPARRAMLRSAAALPGMHLSSDELDARDDALACRDELIILGDRDAGVTTRPLRRSDLVTRSTRVCYDPGILEEDRTPQLVRDYLATFVPDPVRQKMLFKALGSCLAGGNDHRLFIILQGESTTGKTQLVEAVYETLGGDYSTIGTASLFRGNMDDKPRPDIIKAITRRVTFFSEASQAWELHGDRVKDLTGGGTVSARLMRSDDFHDIRPTFTPILVTNVMPKIIGADPALLRRMLVFDFNHRPLVEDVTIRDRFIHDPEVQTWLLARLVRGYEESVREGLGDVIVAQGIATMEAFDNLTHLGSFFRWLTDTDQLTLVPEDEQGAYGVKSTFVTLKDTYDRYSFWVREYGAKRDTAAKFDYETFNEQLRNNGWERVKSGAWRWKNRRLVPLLHIYNGLA